MGQGCSRSTSIQKSPPAENEPTAYGVHVPSTHRSFPPSESRPRSQSNIREAGVSSAFTPAAIALWERQHKKKWVEDVIPNQTEDPCDTSVVSREGSTLDNLTPHGHLQKQSTTRMMGVPEGGSEMSAMDNPDRWQQQTPSRTIRSTTRVPSTTPNQRSISRGHRRPPSGNTGIPSSAEQSPARIVSAKQIAMWTSINKGKLPPSFYAEPQLQAQTPKSLAAQSRTVPPSPPQQQQQQPQVPPSESSSNLQKQSDYFAPPLSEISTTPPQPYAPSPDVSKTETSKDAFVVTNVYKAHLASKNPPSNVTHPQPGVSPHSSSSSSYQSSYIPTTTSPPSSSSSSSSLLPPPPLEPFDLAYDPGVYDPLNPPPPPSTPPPLQGILKTSSSSEKSKYQHQDHAPHESGIDYSHSHSQPQPRSPLFSEKKRVSVSDSVGYSSSFVLNSFPTMDPSPIPSPTALEKGLGISHEPELEPWYAQGPGLGPIPSRPSPKGFPPPPSELPPDDIPVNSHINSAAYKTSPLTSPFPRNPSSPSLQLEDLYRGLETLVAFTYDGTYGGDNDDMGGFINNGFDKINDVEIEAQHLYRMRDKGILTIDEFASAMEKIQKRRSNSRGNSPGKGSYNGQNGGKGGTPPRGGGMVNGVMSSPPRMEMVEVPVVFNNPIYEQVRKR